MEDSRIVELFWRRSENAIRETELAYGRYGKAIASIIAWAGKNRKTAAIIAFKNGLCKRTRSTLHQINGSNGFMLY